MIHVAIDTNSSKSGKRAAEKGASLINNAIRENGKAQIILATGASQFSMLEYLVQYDIDWGKVTAFHLDEYIGISPEHPASFCRYLQERFIAKISTPLAAFHFLNSDEEPETVRRGVGEILAGTSIDVAFVGIGENGHLAFNDPPANFEIEDPYLIVELDEDCRRQQLGEGWFSSLDEVPRTAISMSIRQILKSKSIICAVPDERKAKAVPKVLEGAVTADVPSSILQTHEDCYIYLDRDSASLLKDKT
jgi:glucosamine-6-phosphate deaminase